MDLSGIKGQYDAIFSLGSNCSAAIQLQKNNIRPFSGVLDWMTSESLADVNRLLRNRFNGFMELPNMSIEGIDAHENSYRLRDHAYNIVSVHDFPISINTPANLVSYAGFKMKMERRIQRFIDKTAACKNILFVRTNGSYEEIIELQSILSGMVGHNCKILLVNYSGAPGLREHYWGLEKVCVLEMQGYDIWRQNDHLWKIVFDGVQLIGADRVIND